MELTITILFSNQKFMFTLSVSSDFFLLLLNHSAVLFNYYVHVQHRLIERLCAVI